MKSKKKFLLLGVGVMGALALGVGATSTFAWFQAAAATSVDTANKSTGNIGVTPTSVSLTYKATINLEFVIPDKSIQLTAWGDDITGLTAGTLYTATVPSNVSNNSSPTYSALDASGIAANTFAIEVKAYLVDTSTNKDEEGHLDAWKAGINGLDGTTGKEFSKTVTFSYTNSDVTVAGDTANPGVKDEGETWTSKLKTEEVYFYSSGYSTAASAAYAQASEGLNGGSQTKTIAISAKDLVTANAIATVNGSNQVTATNSTRVGWLYVRFDGGNRQHDKRVNYQADIAANFPA